MNAPTTYTAANDREALIRAAGNVAAMIARMANDTGDYANAVRRDNYRSAALLASQISTLDAQE
jgi:hypothetical protein